MSTEGFLCVLGTPEVTAPVPVVDVEARDTQARAAAALAFPLFQARRWKWTTGSKGSGDARTIPTEDRLRSHVAKMIDDAWSSAHDPDSNGWAEIISGRFMVKAWTGHHADAFEAGFGVYLHLAGEF